MEQNIEQLTVDTAEKQVMMVMKVINDDDDDDDDRRHLFHCDDDIVADDDDNDDDNNDNDDYLHCAGLDLFPEGSTRRYQVHQSGDVHQACGG